MQNLTPAGMNLVNDISNRYHLSNDAVIHMLVAVNNGGGSMAQFNCPELGGSGQWMRGGMTMVGDMFNHGLKMTVDNLCSELANALVNTQVFPVIPAGTPGSNQWWPSHCGNPFSSGAQNNIRYAVFPGKLAVEMNGQVTVYNTLNHNIGGVSQQQGGDTSLTFSSQFGTVSVNQLPIISGPGTNVPPVRTNFAEPAINEPVANTAPYSENKTAPNNNSTFNSPINPTSNQTSNPALNPIPNSVTTSTDDVINLIGQLAKLRDAGALTEQDFNTKKMELLARI
jgi:hypothetical protein